MKTKLVLVFVLISSCFYSQNQTSKWLFGQYTGLDFLTSPPSVITGSMYTSEGCASMSDNAGNLLFYTNGVQVWDQTHTTMANGNNLLGHTSTTQSSMIVKQPGNNNLYYIFTLDELGYSNGLRYSVVDMNLAAGMGSVTIKNVPLYTPSTEKMAAVKHCNKTDTWIVTHEWGTNVFKSFLLNASGVAQPPVNSAVGITHIGGDSQYAKIGSMKISPNGKKLGICLRGGLDRVELYDFDDATGTVSNPVILSNMPNAYGCEFSPDGSKFYAATAEGGVMSALLYQWDLCGASPLAIAASRVTIDSSNYDHHRALQLGMDGKIYVAHIGYTPIGVINSPNSSGLSCNYNDAGQPAGLCQLGLPGFVATYFKPALPPFTYTLSCQTVSFSAGPYPTCSALGFDYTSANWNFGDASQNGTGFSASHFYSPGTYTVLCLLNRTCSSDTIKQVITVPSQFPTFNISGPASICKGASTTLGINNTSNTYTWLPGPIINNLAIVSPTSTTVYTVTATHTLTGCTSTKAFSLTVSPCTSVSEENKINSGIVVFPNPSDGTISITAARQNLPNGLRATIIDVTGRTIKTISLSVYGENKIDLSELSKGIYTLLIGDQADQLFYKEKLVIND